MAFRNEEGRDKNWKDTEVKQGQSMWNLWGANWLWDRFLLEFFGFSLSISFLHGSPYSYIILGINNRPVGGCSLEM
jgi:hypothetical protein